MRSPCGTSLWLVWNWSFVGYSSATGSPCGMSLWLVRNWGILFRSFLSDMVALWDELVLIFVLFYWFWFICFARAPCSSLIGSYVWVFAMGCVALIVGNPGPFINPLASASGASCCTLHCAVCLTSRHLCPLWLGCGTLHQVGSVDDRLAALLLLWPLWVAALWDQGEWVWGFSFVFNVCRMLLLSLVSNGTVKFPPANSVVAGPCSAPVLGLVCYINHSGNVYWNEIFIKLISIYLPEWLIYSFWPHTCNSERLKGDGWVKGGRDCSHGS